MKKAIHLCSFFLALIFLSGCGSSDELLSTSSQHVDFYRYKSYSLLEWDTNNDSIVDAEVKERILYSIANELNLRGFHYNEDGGDMRIAVHVLLDKKKAEIQYNQYYTSQNSNNYETHNMGFNSTTSRFDEYEMWEGTLLIDIIDHETKNLIWQGANVNILKKAATTEERNLRIEQIVANTLEDFPINKINN